MELMQGELRKPEFAQILEIRSLFKTKTLKEIAVKYSVCDKYVSKIVAGVVRRLP